MLSAITSPSMPFSIIDKAYSLYSLHLLSMKYATSCDVKSRRGFCSDSFSEIEGVLEHWEIGFEDLEAGVA